MAKTEEIPRNEWEAWLPRISATLRDRKARIEMIGREVGAQELAELPLLGLSFDVEGVEIAVSRTPPIGGTDEHRIPKPVRLFAEYGDDGTVECLDVEDEEGNKTLVSFLPQDALTIQP